MASPTSSHVNGNVGDDFEKYLTLYKASVAGNWDEAQNFLNQDQDYNNNNNNNAAALIFQAPINHNLDTTLHVAAKTGNAFFAQKLVAKLADNNIGLKNQYGLTPLHLAARFGNIEVAKIIVARNYNLLYQTCDKGLFPIHYAACNTRNNKDVYLYFYGVTKDNDAQTNPYATQTGATILVNLIKSKFYDVAMELVDKYPDLTRYTALDLCESEGLHPLVALVQYDYPIITQTPTHVSRRWESMQLVMHKQAVELLKCLCKKLKTLNDSRDASIIASRAILEATYLDIDEVVRIVVEEHPATAYCRDDSGRNILHIAVENRCTNVFNLVCHNRVLMHDLVDERDNNKNNIVHLVGKLAPPHKLNLVSGAALQMQRELQWFKEVQKIALPYYSSMKNGDGKTPNRVFTEEHKDLKMEGEKWMKDTAISCTIVAALIVTVVFAAAITVPGGNDDKKGYPNFSKSDVFTAFYLSNGVSLFTSISSLLLFLSILTSRYAEEDFSYALPRRLIIGLFALLLSIMFMMVAFSTTAYLLIARRSLALGIVLIAVACAPVTLFVVLEFRLLVALIRSTYGHNIFNKHAIPQISF